MNTFICYDRCSTCKKAEKWLIAHDIAYTKRPIKEDNPTVEELKDFKERSGLPLKRFFNTSGALYRSQNIKDKLKDMLPLCQCGKEQGNILGAAAQTVP